MANVLMDAVLALIIFGTTFTLYGLAVIGHKQTIAKKRKARRLALKKRQMQMHYM